jgi:hypothetical protein
MVPGASLNSQKDNLSRIRENSSRIRIPDPEGKKHRIPDTQHSGTGTLLKKLKYLAEIRIGMCKVEEYRYGITDLREEREQDLCIAGQSKCTAVCCNNCILWKIDKKW